MKTRLIAIFSVLIGLSFVSCNEETEDLGNWVNQHQFPGMRRSEGAYFTIGDNGYWGLGYNKTESDFYTDLWRYNPSSDSWREVSSFPGTPRYYSVCANSETKGYVGLGYDGDSCLVDFWEYDAAANTWTQLPDFPAEGRKNAIAFAIEDYLFAGMGSANDNNSFLDLYYYHNGTWNSSTAIINSFPNKVTQAQVVVKDGDAYVLGGLANGVYNGFVKFDFELFKEQLSQKEAGSDIDIDPWVELADLDDTDDDTKKAEKETIPRYNGVAFVSSGNIFLTLGRGNGGAITTTTFEYDEIVEDWVKKTNFEGPARQGAGVFVLRDNNNKDVPYIVGGSNGQTYFDDVWLFEPYNTKDTNDN